MGARMIVQEQMLISHAQEEVLILQVSVPAQEPTLLLLLILLAVLVFATMDTLSQEEYVNLTQQHVRLASLCKEELANQFVEMERSFLQRHAMTNLLESATQLAMGKRLTINAMVVLKLLPLLATALKLDSLR
jgi:hypothetical protein